MAEVSEVQERLHSANTLIDRLHELPPEDWADAVFMASLEIEQAAVACSGSTEPICGEALLETRTKFRQTLHDLLS